MKYKSGKWKMESGKKTVAYTSDITTVISRLHLYTLHCGTGRYIHGG
jgi:hypothetical protein